MQTNEIRELSLDEVEQVAGALASSYDDMPTYYEIILEMINIGEGHSRSWTFRT